MEKPRTERRVFEAASLAARWHAKQRRKGEAEEPYINHLLEVAALIERHAEGASADLLIAALLHDGIEDQGIAPEVIRERFGPRVLSIVEEVSDDKNLPKKVRKQLQIDRASSKSREAKVLVLADKISNLTTLAESPPTDWTPTRRVEYVSWCRAVVDQMRGVSGQLESLFDAAADAAELAARKP